MVQLLCHKISYLSEQLGSIPGRYNNHGCVSVVYHEFGTPIIILECVDNDKNL